MGMYNPYIEQPPMQAEAWTEPAGPRQSRARPGPLDGIFDLFRQEQKDAGIAGILKGFGLEQIDTGDILLVLILLLLVAEGDDTEMIITLALVLLMGLGDRQDGQV